MVELFFSFPSRPSISTSNWGTCEFPYCSTCFFVDMFRNWAETHHLTVPVVNCNMCESFKIGIPWHHCDPLDSSHFQLVFGKLLSSMVWWLVLPQFQLHQPLTSCIGQLGCHLGGILWWHRISRIDPKNLIVISSCSEFLGGHVGDLKIEQSRFMSFHWYCFKFQIYTSSSKVYQ